MQAVTLTAINGSWVRIDPERVEYLRAAPEGVHVRLLGGERWTVRGTYLEVMEKLALA